MQLKSVSTTGSDRLLLIFAGWGTDWRLFDKVRANGRDVAVVWDYRDDSIDISMLSRYRDIKVYAWSFGVFFASRFLMSASLPVTRKIAINGTLTPIDDLTGIPDGIFRGTLDGLNERTLSKFYRRICGSSESYRRIAPLLSGRDIGELRRELERVLELSREQLGDVEWDEAVISASDAIFSPSNMERAWAHTPIRHIAGAHMPDFDTIFHPVDKALVATRFSGSRGTYEANAIVQRRIAGRLFDMWRHVGLPAPGSRVLEIGAGTGLFTRMYLPELAACDVELWDIAPCDVDGCRVRICDAEDEITRHAGMADCIVSASTLQWFADAPAFISNAMRRLNPSGLLVVSTFGPGNLPEIAGIVGTPLRYPTLDDLCRQAAGCEIVAAEERRDTIHFRDPAEVMRHLRLTGTTGTPLSRHGSVTATRRLLRDYPRDSEGCPLTYHSYYLILKKR
ncbi:MAG: DUF452 family protein [Muribaculaceae bacterium]